MVLTPGAVQLPLAHLSVRVPWHDTDWTGRVCRSPATNHACTALPNIKARKDADEEETHAGAPWSDAILPPCLWERAGFMRPQAFSAERRHTYAKKSSHAHFERTVQRMPAYSFEAAPYRWVLRENVPPLVEEWAIDFDQAFEDRADKIMSYAADWVQDHRNQLAMLDSFFSAIQPRKSLVFVYAKDVPIFEQHQRGARALLGAGWVTSVADYQEWGYRGTPSPAQLRSVIWERSIGHSIRPELGDGFLLPYQQLLANPAMAGEELGRFVALAPDGHFTEFSYVSEHVGHDAAIAALVELARVVELLPGVADGPWEHVGAWLSDRIADAWNLRGPYPGLGSALAAAGIPRGALVAHRVCSSSEAAAADPWPAIEAAIVESTANRGPAAGLVGRMAVKAWDRVRSEEKRYRLLRLLARFQLTAEQARRMFDQPKLVAAGVTATELLENPYLIYELDRGRSDAVPLAAIDRGLFPNDALARRSWIADPSPDPVTEAGDDRRVRAAAVEALTRAANDGHTLLHEAGLRRRMAALALSPACDPVSDLFDLATELFPPVLRPVELRPADGRGWQLASLARACDCIIEEVTTRLGLGAIEVEWDWRQRIDEAIGGRAAGDETAREEKSMALRVLARSRVSVLVGPAGTGKTSMLKALCAHPEVRSRGVLLLAPTGKARVQLADKVGARALTLAQFLRPHRWAPELGYRMNPDARREVGFATVVVDESSMLTEEMLAALLDALDGVDRLVLCGDHRQLPPIGAGRPFADLIAFLRGRHVRTEDGGGVAELTVPVRQLKSDGQVVNAPSGRDDIAVASWFSSEGPSPGADEAFARVLEGDSDGTITFVRWNDEDELHEKLIAMLEQEIGSPRGFSEALRHSLGATAAYKGRASFVFGDGGRGAENWQILAPMRSLRGGISSLNALVRRGWRVGDATAAHRQPRLPSPMGADEILFYDKVMCVANHQRKAYRPSDGAKEMGEIANGEIGMAVTWPVLNGWASGLTVEFSTQPGWQFTFWEGELNGESEEGEQLELAYAVTIHKAQGSQFNVTFVVLPNPCALLSPELLYTGLTRQRDRTVVFFQGDPTELRALVGPARSATAQRLTRLFRTPEPIDLDERRVLDGSHVHRTTNGEMVCSKSELIVAEMLRRLNIRYLYEKPLAFAGESPRFPDFTLVGLRRPVFWEHLGMLDRPGYRADWERKRAWYQRHGILPWREGGGAQGILVWSTEKVDSRGIDLPGMEGLANEVVALAQT